MECYKERLKIRRKRQGGGGEGSVYLKKVSGIAHEKFLTSQLDLKISSFVKILLFSKTLAEIFCIPTLVMAERIYETCVEYIYIDISGSPDHCYNHISNLFSMQARKFQFVFRFPLLG